MDAMLDANHLILKIIQWSFQLDMNYARYDFLFWLAQYNTFFRVCFFGPSISLSIYHLSSHLLVFASLLVFSYGAKFQEWAFFPACSMSFLYVHIFHQIEMLALVYVSRGVIGEMIGVLGGFPPISLSSWASQFEIHAACRASLMTLYTLTSIPRHVL